MESKRIVALVALLGLGGCGISEQMGACERMCRYGVKEFRAESPTVQGSCTCIQAEDLCKKESR